MKRVLIGGTHSGCGKTTVTCALLAAINHRNISVSAFKCGPDYIDPMFHRKVIGIPSYNLDSFFCNKDTLLYLLEEYGKSTDISVIEGVMGFYDGTVGSSCSISELTDTPAVIVIDCKGMSDSIGAVMKGFLSYHPNKIKGFIFNRLPEKLIHLAKGLCSELRTGYFGYLPKCEITIESRHLGLVTADEISDIKDKLDRLGELAERYICIDKLIEFENVALPKFTAPLIPRFPNKPVIAVARDSAFCFIYSENIELLEKMGCRIKYFSPLTDSAVPNADGLILSGGYPELYASELSANTAMLESVRKCISGGMPTIAECGGFMYLHKILTDKNGVSHTMVDIIDGECKPTSGLRRFGYITMYPECESMLCMSGKSVKAHEFHYFESTSCGEAFTAQKLDGRTWKCCHVSDSLYAGFPHINFLSDISLAERFVMKCVIHGEINV